MFVTHRWHTEAVGSSTQIAGVSRCWMYRMMTKSASKAARITQTLRRIARNPKQKSKVGAKHDVVGLRVKLVLRG
jgi:hypothetical protein